MPYTTQTRKHHTLSRRSNRVRPPEKRRTVFPEGSGIFSVATAVTMAFSCTGNMYAALSATINLVGSSTAVGLTIEGWEDSEMSKSVSLRPF